MSTNPQSLRVLIVGAGSAGLLVAQVLKQAGIPCTVFEQDTNIRQRPRDWSFGLYWARSRLHECLSEDIWPLLKTVQTSPNYEPVADSVMPVHNGETGELLKNLPAPWSVRLRRKKFIELLSNGIDVKWNKRLKYIETAEDTVTAFFEDGTKETGNLLVGAEGAHSPTREFLLGKEEASLLPSPAVANVIITKVSRDASMALRALHPKNSIAVHPNGTFVWQSNPANWTWMLMQTWLSDEPTGLKGDNILPAICERGKCFSYPFNEAFATIPEGTLVWHSRLSYWPTKPWDNRGGLVTLAGDAAHPMTFHRGQGLNNAITDAADLLVHLREMKEHTPAELAAAVNKYERELWPRGNKEVIVNNENTMAIHDWTAMREAPIFTSGMARRT
ncbi:FAD protein [Venustampulla echinocandica]|uniref:FAD protein n=1 Tax=Venustampulla echinocandica TaxID=2656787 RepID=A0A370TVT0_9HELO|nr:FAD protein [Venustampulla echinocandica]RDL39632.1 FAD protein [Venustampulla echinocandica]